MAAIERRNCVLDVDEQFRNARTPNLASMANDQVGYVRTEVSVVPTIVRPDFDIQHSMVGARMGFNLAGIGMSFSYLRVRRFSRAEEAVVTGNTIDVNVDLTLSYEGTCRWHRYGHKPDFGGVDCGRGRVQHP